MPTWARYDFSYLTKLKLTEVKRLVRDFPARKWKRWYIDSSLSGSSDLGLSTLPLDYFVGPEAGACVWVIYLWGDLRDKDRGTRGSLRKKKKKGRKSHRGWFCWSHCYGPLGFVPFQGFLYYLCISLRIFLQRANLRTYLSISPHAPVFEGPLWALRALYFQECICAQGVDCYLILEHQRNLRIEKERLRGQLRWDSVGMK